MAAESVVRLVFLGDSAQAVRSVERLEGAVGGLGKTSKLLVGGIGIALVGALAASTKAAINFQSQMELIHTQAGASTKEIERMSKALLALAPAVGQTPTELAKGLFHVESAGFRGAKALQILQAAAKGAAIGHANLEDTVNSLVGALKVGEKGAGGFDHTMAVLNATIGSGNMRLSDLNSALATGLLSAAKSVGIPIQDVGAALGELTDQGQGATASATRLQMAFLTMAANTKKGIDALKGIGITQNQLAQDMRTHGLVFALQDLKTHLEQSGKSAIEQNAIIADVFGRRSLKAILPLLQRLDDVAAKQRHITAQTADYGQAWAATQHTVQFQLDRAKAAIVAAAIPIGTLLLPAVTRIAKGVADAANAVGRHMGNIRKYASEAASGIGAAWTQDAVPALSAFGGILSKLVDIIKQEWPEIQRTAEAVLGALANAATGAGTVIGGVLIGAVRLLGAVLDPILKLIQYVADALNNQFVRALVAGTAAVAAAVYIVRELQAAFLLARAAVASFIATSSGLVAVNPILLGLYAAVAILAAAFVLFRGNTESLQHAQDNLANSIRDVHDAMLELSSANLSVKEASLNHAQATQAAVEALQTYRHIMGSSTATTNEKKDALLQLRAADLAVKRSTLELAQAKSQEQKDTQKTIDSIARQRRAMNDLDGKLKDAGKALKNFAQLHSTNGPTFEGVRKIYENSVRSLLALEKSFHGAATRAQQLADENRKSHPVFAENEQAIADTAKKHEEYAKRLIQNAQNLGLVSNKTVDATGKVKEFSKQLSELDGKHVHVTIDVIIDRILKGVASGKGKGYAEGGIVPGSTGAPVQALVHGGEVILNPAQQAAFGGAQFFKRAFGFQGGGRSFSEGGIVDPGTKHRKVPEWAKLSEAARRALLSVHHIRGLEHGAMDQAGSDLSSRIDAKEYLLSLLGLEKGGVIAAIQAVRDALKSMKGLKHHAALSGRIDRFEDDLADLLREKGTIQDRSSGVRSSLHGMLARMNREVGSPFGGKGLLANVGALQSAVAIQTAQEALIGSFAGGTLNVPATGLALVHAGEQIVPAGRARDSGDRVQEIVVNLKLGGPLEPLANFITATVDTPQVAEKISVRIGKSASARARSGRY